MKFYINPLNQQILHQDPIYKPKEVWVLDQLNDDLTFKIEIGKASGSEGPRKFLERMVQIRDFKSRKIKPVEAGGWVVLEHEGPYSWEQLWPQAMKKLGNGNTLKLI